MSAGKQLDVLEVVAKSPDAPLTKDLIQSAHRDKILCGGAIVGNNAIQEAIQQGVKGIVVGGIHDSDLRALLGYELGGRHNGFRGTRSDTGRHGRVRGDKHGGPNF